MNKVDEVTDHAIIKYLERHDKNKLKQLTNLIKEKILNGYEVYSKFPVKKLINNGFKKQRFIRHKNIVFVISEDNAVVTTLQWNNDSFTVER